MFRRSADALAFLISLTSVCITSPAHAWPGEDFDERSPYNWSRTMFPQVISHEHQLGREDPCADTCLLPPGGSFHVTQCTDDREGICTALSPTPVCDAFALRRPVGSNFLIDSHSTAYIAATGLGAGQEQRVGLVARAGTTTVAGVTEISSGYAAILQVFNGTSNPVEGVVQIVRLDGPCIEEGTLLATSSPPFAINCAQEFHLKFTVVGSTLRATLDRIRIGTTGGVVSEAVVMNGSTNNYELVTQDFAFGGPGLNGVVGYTPMPGSVYWDDVRVFELSTVSFDNATIGSVIGGQANQSPGDLAYSEGGVDFRVQTVTPPGQGAQPIFGFGQFVSTPAGLGGGVGLRVSDMALNWDPAAGGVEINIVLGRLPGATPQDRWVNFSVGGPLYIGPLLGLESDPVDMYDVDPFALPMQTGGQSFRLDVASTTLNAVTFGGHDAIIDALYLGTQVTECAADFNGDGSVSVQDIFDMLAAYFSGSAAADVNGDGGLTVQDIFDYLLLYFTGCA